MTARDVSIEVELNGDGAWFVFPTGRIEARAGWFVIYWPGITFLAAAEWDHTIEGATAVFRSKADGKLVTFRLDAGYELLPVVDVGGALSVSHGGSTLWVRRP